MSSTLSQKQTVNINLGRSRDGWEVRVRIGIKEIGVIGELD